MHILIIEYFKSENCIFKTLKNIFCEKKVCIENEKLKKSVHYWVALISLNKKMVRQNLFRKKARFSKEPYFMAAENNKTRLTLNI